MDNIVEVVELSKSYGDVKAIENVSFGIKEGKFFSLLGPSGCGKTTILRIIGGFLEQDSGKVIIDGKNMKGIPPNKRNTSMVFQDLALFPHMNVKDNIIYGLRKRRIEPVLANKKFDRIINILGLQGYGKRSVSALSGGQRQRVALARSLILEPEILLLDEPLASLDKKLRLAMEDELKQVQRKLGTTFLYVTHDQSEALTMSDTIAVMKDGYIIQVGSPDHIYNNPNNVFTADFIGTGNFIQIKDITDRGNYLELETEKDIRFRLKKKGPTKKEPVVGDRLEKPVFFIRPEKIIISDLIKENANVFKGFVRSVVFEGPDIRLDVDSEGLGIVRIEIKNDGTQFNIKNEDYLKFYWNQKDGTILYY